MRRAVIGMMFLLAACVGSPEPADPGAVQGSLLVSVAASLADAFADLETGFETVHQHVDVILNTGSSATLRSQILEGAPVDVYASAGAADMDMLDEIGYVETPRVLARGHMVVAVPAGNPGGIVALADLSREDLLIGLCAETVPCGDLARQILDSATVSVVPDTLESDVRSLVVKLETGELDAGIAYATAVHSSDVLEAVAIPAEHNVGVAYPVAYLIDAPNLQAAKAFVAYILSDHGRNIFLRHGFDAP